MTKNTEIVIKRLCNLFDLLESDFTEDELEEVKDFIDLGEYGLALETIVNIIEDEKKELSNKIYRLIYDLAKIMSFEHVNYVGRN